MSILDSSTTGVNGRLEEKEEDEFEDDVLDDDEEWDDEGSIHELSSFSSDSKKRSSSLRAKEKGKDDTPGSKKPKMSQYDEEELTREVAHELDIWSTSRVWPSHTDEVDMPSSLSSSSE